MLWCIRTYALALQCAMYVCLLASTAKNVFALSCKNPGSTRHSHVLQASSEYDKRLWMDSFRSVLPAVGKPTSAIESVV